MGIALVYAHCLSVAYAASIPEPVTHVSSTLLLTTSFFIYLLVFLPFPLFISPILLPVANPEVVYGECGVAFLECFPVVGGAILNKLLKMPGQF